MASLNKKNFKKNGVGGGFGLRMPSRERSRGQAAIFDGITFLLMVGFSCALVYSVITTYGESMDSALNSFYELNYLQSAVKSLYYLNLQQLPNVADNGDELLPAYKVDPALNSDTLGCKQFASYTGSTTVLDLLKKDLSDYPNEPGSEAVILDDNFSGVKGGVTAPGRQALRCALKELMKPFVLAGYDYYAEVVCPQCTPSYKAIKFGGAGGVGEGGARVTSNAALADSNPSTGKSVGDEGGCALMQTPEGGSYRALSMSVPLRISLGTSCGSGEGVSCQRNYILRVCVWQTR
jgi:hypothetical protein